MYSYTLVINRKSYDLPSKNIYLVEEMERVSRIDQVRGMSTRDKFAEILKFITTAIGEENVKEIFGSNSLEAVDLSLVTIVFRMIVDAYNKPIAEYNAKKGNEVFSNIPDEKIEKLSKLIGMAKELPND